MAFIIVGLKVAIALAVIGAVIGEFVGAEDRLGYLVLASWALPVRGRCVIEQSGHLFLLRDKKRERLMLVARLPESGAHLSDSIRRGKELPPCHWLHAAEEGCLLVLFACVLVLVSLHRHLDTTGGSIQELCSHPVAFQLGIPADCEVLSKSRERWIEDDGDEFSSGLEVARCRTEEGCQLLMR